MNFLSQITSKLFARGSIYLLLVIGMVSCQQEPSRKMSELLPAPQEVEFKEGISISPKNFNTIYLYSEAGENAEFSANLLKEKITQLFNYSPKLEVIQSYEALSRPAILLGIPSKDREFSNFCSELPSPKKGNGESYVLDVKDDEITVSGGGRSGLFYGVQTLIQLMEESKWEDESLQGMLIQDWPDMDLRTVHYNYFFHLDRYEYIKESIEKLAKRKVNGIVFEFEDKFQYQSHPVLAAPNSLTAKQVKELTQYAHKYHIDIIPLVQGLGHAGFILKHDRFKHLREDPEINQSFCPLKDGTYELLFDMYRETIEATPGVKYFHIGGDEVRVMGECPLCRDKKKEMGELGLYLTWLNRVHDFMEKHDRTMIFWDDMPLKEAGIYRTTHSETPREEFDSLWAKGIPRLNNVIEKFPRDAIFMRWNYGLAREKGNIGILDWYRKHDFKRTIATAIIGNYPLIPDYDWTPSNIKSFLTLGAEKDVMGALCTAWGDDAGNHFEIYWLGFLASAEYGWSSESPAKLDEYWDKYLRRFFGPNTNGLVPAFHNLSKRVEFWNNALLEEGKKHRLDYRNHLISLPDLQDAPEESTWEKQFQPLMKKAKKEREKCTQAMETLEENMDRVTRNDYNLEVFASMGSLMKTHCDFVISLGEIAGYCDKARMAHENDQKEKVVTNLNKMANIADSAWNQYEATYQDLKEVWQESRYPKGGEGYIMNPQTNYLAGRTADLSYLILAEKKLELPKYVEILRQMADQYQEKGSFSF
ncbi:MAG: family 20 glycosylhydrolase [bacterium]